jgi:aspartate racemase
MKTLGLIGGLSWESTALYYEYINKEINKNLGKLHSAKIVLISVDLEEIVSLQSTNEWDKAGEILADAAISLEKAGADIILLCANTMHKVAQNILKVIHIPFLHITEPTIKRIKENRINKIGILSTKFTMEEAFYRKFYTEQDIEVVTPDKVDIEIIHEIIYTELCKGVITERSKKEIIRIINRLNNLGAQAIILACTEISLLINQNDTDILIIDTLKEHALAAANASLT